MKESLLTVDEVAKFVKVKPRTVRDWIERGSMGIPVYRVHRQYRFREADLQGLLARSSDPVDHQQSVVGRQQSGEVESSR